MRRGLAAAAFLLAAGAAPAVVADRSVSSPGPVIGHARSGVDVDAPPPIVLGDGSGQVLGQARRCRR